MKKEKFTCDVCDVTVTVRLGDDFEEADIGFCPCCGSPHETDDDTEEDDE
jgi:hypothetical protein